MDTELQRGKAEEYIRRANPALNTLLVEQHGKVIYARVFDSSVTLNSPWPIRSITKSVCSALIGIAIEQGFIQDVNQPVARLLEGAKRLPASTGNLSQTSLHQLLTMTTGIPWHDGAFGNEPMIRRVVRQDNWLDYILRLPVTPSLAGQFQYNSAVSHLLSAIVNQRTGMATELFAEQVLFKPLGINQYQWERDPLGLAIGGWGLSLAPVDLAKFGRLYVAGGRWQNQQVLPACWVTQTTTAYSPQYGYQWWSKTLNGLHTWCALGIGGQCVCCIPSHDAVIVTTSKSAGKRKLLWPLFEKFWLPMIA